MQEIIKKINERLKPTGWYDEMRIFLESSDFSSIIETLKKKVEVDKQRFCPGLGSAFRFLENIQYEKVKAVIVVEHTTNRLDQADGVPLSTLDEYYDSVPRTIFKSIDNVPTYDVLKWLEQGVLLVPLSLTSRIDGKAHKKLWQPFLMRIIEVVNKKEKNIPWVLLGTDSWQYEDDIASPYIRKVEIKKPMEDTNWASWINQVIGDHGRSPIKWK